MKSAALLAGLAMAWAFAVAAMSRRCCCQDTPPGTGCGRRRFQFFACNSGGGLTGASVVVTDGGGATVFSGTATGVSEIWTGTLPTGTYSWTATHPSGRLQAATGTFTIVCPTGDATIPVAFLPASGYVCSCIGMGPLPVKTTLAASLGGDSFSLVYNAGVDGHLGVADVSWAGCDADGVVMDCPPATIPLTVFIPTTGARCSNMIPACCVSVAPPALLAQPCGVRYIEYALPPTGAGGNPVNYQAVVYGAVFGTCNGAPLDPAGQSTLIVTE